MFIVVKRSITRPIAEWKPYSASMRAREREDRLGRVVTADTGGQGEDILARNDSSAHSFLLPRY